MFFNYDFSFRSGGKFIFVQNADSRRNGERLIEFIEANARLPDHFFHYQKGGHVAALHRHLRNAFFFRIDLQNFFYSVSRNRVAAALHHIGFAKARTFAKWSCVKNPIRPGPAYALPIGFVQSPALASLVLMRSPVAAAIEAAMRDGAYVSVYMDDLIGSAPDLARLTAVFEAVLAACREGSFPISERKLLAPSDRIEAFNCELRHGFSAVTEARVARFFSEPRSFAAAASFDAYRRSVAKRNL